ncbi:MAG: antibiotic biosynthesis monooxygenase [Actinomycetota bacterium]|nr:antibiotic biosynthesis monooxygenase [Actinomycetota bacterium]
MLERAVIIVRPGTEAAFAAAFPEAQAVILSADGCNSARLLRGIESPSSFLLLVEWDSLAHHMEGFRNSPLFAEWRAILGPYFAEPPVVEHFIAAD